MHATLRKLYSLTVLTVLAALRVHPRPRTTTVFAVRFERRRRGSRKKAREQKKEAPKPKKVYTDDDISTKKSDISLSDLPPLQRPPLRPQRTQQNPLP